MLMYDLAQHNLRPSLTSSELDLELKLCKGRTNPIHTPYALNGVAQGYLPMQGYLGRCAIHTSHPSILFFVDSSSGFEIYSAWTSSTEYASSMSSLLPQTWSGPQLKHAKGVEIVLGDMESLSSYPHYWESCLVPHLLIGNFDRLSQPAQGWNCHQAVFCHSYLGGNTDGKHSLLLLTPPAMILHPSPYSEIKISNGILCWIV